MATIQTMIRVRDGFSSTLDRFNNGIRTATQNQQQLNNSMQSNAASGLTRQIGKLISAYSLLTATTRLVNLSDDFTLATSRLSLLTEEMKNANGELETTAELQDKIYNAAQRSRASYMDMMGSISKLGLLAGDAFKNTDEIVAFTETLNKAFTVGGTGSREKSMAMYQLTQAMGSGRLQGDEFRSIIENAPMVAQAIEDYMRNVKKAEGTMKEWSAQGLLTADVIKAAVFDAADEINDKFETIPYTWGQVWETCKNAFIRFMEPVLKGISWIANHWEQLVPIIAFATTIMLGYVIATNAATIAAGALAVVQNLGAIATFFLQGVVWLATTALSAMASACGAAAFAQELLNIAMTFSPIGLIIILIGILIVWFVKLAQELGSIYAAWLTVWDGICTNTAGAVEFILSIVQTCVNEVIRMINEFIGLLNKIPGVSIEAIGEVQWADDFASYANKKHLERQAKIADAINKNGNSGFDLEAYLNSMYSQIPSTSTAGTGGSGGTGSAIAKNTAKTADAVTKSSEDLKWLREIAERKAINQFTTAEIKVDMGGVNNVVNSNMDLDGVVSYLEETLTETMASVAEGNHV